ncbi:MAG TPA: DUF4382 domain-containing protein [Geothrix sp.]|nr:DUF4382 domain-containing protein [Geothrix sp.]
MRRFLFLPALLLLGVAIACGGGSSSPPPPTGTLALRLGSDSFPGYDQVVVSLEKVEASRDGSSWVPLGDVKATFDLMAIQNGQSALIIPATRLNTGTYTQFRLTWATVNYLDQSRQPSYVTPTGAATGQILTMPASTVATGAITISDSVTTSAQIMLNGQQAVQQRAGVQPFRFTATGQAYNLGAIATIAGNVSDASGPLAAVEVFAETVDGLGTATLQRRAFTNASGDYRLEALPKGGTYFVVAQPAGTSVSYHAAAGDPVDAAAATSYPMNLVFASPVSPGDLNLTISPASTDSQVTWGELRQALPTGTAGNQFLIVRSQTAASGIAQDQIGFLGLAPGLYGITAQRSTSGAAPAMKVGPSITINASATTNATLSYP